MDINEQIQSIAAGLIDNLKANLDQELRSRITDEVIQRIAQLELDDIISTSVEKELKVRLNKLNLQDISKNHLTKVLVESTEYINKQLVETAKTQLAKEVTTVVSKVDLGEMVGGIVRGHISNLVKSMAFADNSIPQRAINFTGLSLTGDYIKGGIIKNFGSTGIEDRSTFVQLTLMDHAAVFEGPVYSPEMQVKGDGSIEGNLSVKNDLIIDGKITINGEISTESEGFNTFIQRSAEHTQELLKLTLDESWFGNYSNIIFDKIRTDGLDLNRITQNERDIIKDNQLGYFITDSNLQRVGKLVDLQTRGEALLCDTFYVTDRRAGVNTLEPSAAFVVWDEECEITVSKRKSDTGYIGTTRRQPLILGSNNNENIVLGIDGTTTIQNLSVGKVTMSSSPGMPSHNAARGTVLFNENPDVGQPVGWISLGGARWASFGKIE